MSKRDEGERSVRWPVVHPEVEAERLIVSTWAQIAADEAEERDAQVVDQIRVEHGRLGLADRLAERVGEVVAISPRGASGIRGRLLAVGQEWASLAGPAGRCFVAIAAIDRVQWTAGGSKAGGGAPDGSTWKEAIRSLVAAGRPVSIQLSDGYACRGRVLRCGADHLDLEPETIRGSGPTESMVVAVRAISVISVH